MSPPHQQVILTVEIVHHWIAQRDDLASQIKELNRKIDAATVFMPGVFAEQAESVEGAASTLNDWILQVIADAGKALSPKEIRQLVAAKGVNVGGENYIYTVIKRLLDRKKLWKTEHGYVSSPPSSKEEIPDQQAGDPQDGFTLSGGGVGALPEAGGT